jgi:hypothetical protein
MAMAPSQPPAPPTRPDLRPEPDPRRRSGRSGWTAGRITSLVVGCMLGLASLGILAGGGVALWADTGGRDAAGYVTSPTRTLSTSTAALITDRIELWAGERSWSGPSWILGTVRVRATAPGDGSVFLGIARTADVDRYLQGTAHSVITDLGSTPRYRVVTGQATAAPPADVDRWAASTQGAGTQTLTWVPRDGSWTIVVMRPDGRPQVTVRADVGATMPHLFAIGLALLGIGLVLGALATLLVVVPVIRASRTNGGER